MSLFRPEVFKAQSSSTFGRILLFTPRISTVLTTLIALTTCGLIAFVFLGSYTKKATVYGQIVPKQGVIKLYAPQSGQIKEIYVKSGQIIRKGDLLVRIGSSVNTIEGETQTRLLDSLDSQKEALMSNLKRNAQAQATLNTQFEKRKLALSTQLGTLHEQRELVQQRKELAQTNEARYKRLMQRDFISKEAYEEKKQALLEIEFAAKQLQKEINTIQQQLLALSVENLQQQDSLTKEANDYSRHLAQIEAQIVDTKTKQEVILKSPQDGIIATVFLEKDQTAQAQQPILAIVPSDAHYEANIYIPSQQMGFIEVGQKVYLRYSAYPYQKFGQYHAEIIEIARTSALLNELTDTSIPFYHNQSVYHIRAALEKEYIIAYGNQVPLMAGMQFEADIMQDKRYIYEWIVEPLFSLREKWYADN